MDGHVKIFLIHDGIFLASILIQAKATDLSSTELGR